jgi:ABC-2 type transport system permease protein
MLQKTVRYLLNDLLLYRRFIALQIKAQWQYKANLAIDTLAYFCSMSLEFVAILLYFVPFPTLLGWKIGEVALLAAVVSIAFGLAELVGGGVGSFAGMIRQGEFDQVLLRPVGAFTQVMGNEFNLRRLGRISQGIISFLVALHFLPMLHWTVIKVVMVCLGILSSTVIFIAVQLLGATLCFWTIETTELTNILTYGGREMLSYPLPIYNQLMQRFFIFVIPLAFGSYVPVCYILGRPLPFDLSANMAFFAPPVALAFALVAGLIWRFGVQHYQSTGT